MDHRYYCTAPEGDHLIPLPDEHQDIVNLKRRINSGVTPAYCPTSAGGCGRTMILAYNEEKRGEGNVRHLRHRVETNQCGLTRDMETHRRIQELMREHFTSQGHRVTLERYNPENRSRADVFISGGSLRDMTVSLEVQLSGMDRPFDLRDALYREGASTVEWLFARNTRERRHIADDVGHALSVHLRDDQVNLGIVHHLTRDSDPVPLSEWWVTPRGLVCAELVEVHHQEALWEGHRREWGRAMIDAAHEEALVEEWDREQIRKAPLLLGLRHGLTSLLASRAEEEHSDAVQALRSYWTRASTLYASKQFTAFHHLPFPSSDVTVRSLTSGKFTSPASMKRDIANMVSRDMGWPHRMERVTPAVSEALDMVQSGEPAQSRRGREWINSHLHPEDAHILLSRIRPRPGVCPRCGLRVDPEANSSAGGYHYECMPRPSTADPDPTLF